MTLLLVQDPTANFAQQLANVVNHAVRIPEGKALIPALVSEIAKSVRPTSESGTTR